MHESVDTAVVTTVNPPPGNSRRRPARSTAAKSAAAHDRDTPRDLTAESCVLGAIIGRNQALKDVADIISAKDFFLPENGKIYDAMLMLDERRDPIDPVTLKDELGPSGVADVGGVAYISRLTDGVPRSTNVAHYARIVKEQAELRQAIRSATEIAARAYDGDLAAVRAALQHAVELHEDVSAGLPEEALADAVVVVQQGRDIEAKGIQYLVDDIVPNYGMLGIPVGGPKVGKSTLKQALGGAVATGREFLGKATRQVRVLDIVPEDPPEYTAWMARNLDVPAGVMTFYRGPILFDRRGLAKIVTTVKQGGYGLVTASSWQALVRGLLRDENDNAGTARIVEDVKAAARETGVPWLVDAHSGKAEDQQDDADPLKAMRGASAAAGAADYLLSLRYADGTFGSRRKLSGKGRFVSFEPITIDFDPATSTYTVVGAAKSVAAETTWRLIVETGALRAEPQTAAEIAAAAGLVPPGDRVTNTHRRQVQQALHGRSSVGIEQQIRFGQKTTLYKLIGVMK